MSKHGFEPKKRIYKNEHSQNVIPKDLLSKSIV